MKKLEDIDPQIVQDFIQEWFQIGTDTSRCDRKKSEEAIAAIYTECKFKVPEFIWVRSPIDAITQITKKMCFGQKLEGSISTEQARMSMANEPRFLRRDTVMEHLISLGKDKEDEARKEFNKTCRSFANTCFFGQHEWWVPQYVFPRQHLGAQYTDMADRVVTAWETLSRNCGWWACYDEAVICVEKPIVQKVNSEWQLHCEDGPAMLYEDGLAMWLINGVKVDEQIVMAPETQTLSQINREDNQDVRSIRIERFGWVRYLMESNAKVIDTRKNEIENTMEALMVAPNGDKRLLVTCPTNRKFALGVPESVNTCYEAQKWLGNGVEPNRVIART